MSRLTDEQRQQLRRHLEILYERALEELGVEGVPPLLK